MDDTIYDLTRGIEITPYVVKTDRIPSLPQVVNISLNGLAHIQATGVVTYQTRVDFVINRNDDNKIISAWQNVDLVKIIDDNETIQGYIVDLSLESKYANGYHSGSMVVQEEGTL